MTMPAETLVVKGWAVKAVKDSPGRHVSLTSVHLSETTAKETLKVVREYVENAHVVPVEIREVGVKDGE